MPFRVLGEGHSATAETFAGSILKPEKEMIYPKKGFLDLWNSHYNFI